MPRQFFCDRFKDNIAYFDLDEKRHLKVLKIRPGDTILFTDGKGFLYEGEILPPGQEATVKILSKKEELSREPAREIEIIIALSKWKRLSLLVEKSVELGVRTITFVSTEHSNYSKLNMEKVEKTVKKALKQCGGTILPQLAYYKTIMKLEQTGSLKGLPILLNSECDKAISTCDFPESVSLIIGPEGGFTQNEIKKMRTFWPELEEISLGRRILRLETAAISALSCILYRDGFETRLYGNDTGKKGE